MFDIHQKTKDFTPPEDRIYYLMAKNGLFLVKRTTFFTSYIPIFSPTGSKGLGWLEPQDTIVRLTLKKKISQKDIQKITEFFRQVCDKYDGSEAIVLIYWNEHDQAYVFHVPEQQAGANVHYKIGKNPEGLIMLGDIHSHGFESASHSVHDNTDEKHVDGIHITIGNVDFNPTYSCSVVCDGMRFMCRPESIIEIAKTDVEVPNDWIGRVTGFVYPVVTAISQYMGATGHKQPAKGTKRRTG